jgi:hypothetical protein
MQASLVEDDRLDFRNNIDDVLLDGGVILIGVLVVRLGFHRLQHLPESWGSESGSS